MAVCSRICCVALDVWAWNDKYGHSFHCCDDQSDPCSSCIAGPMKHARLVSQVPDLPDLALEFPMSHIATLVAKCQSYSLLLIPSGSFHFRRADPPFNELPKTMQYGTSAVNPSVRRHQSSSIHRPVSGEHGTAA